MQGAGEQGGCALPSLESIYARLDQVYDPELDESIVRLGFVDDVRIDGDEVTVVYKLPTFWCAPNFAYMMSADVREQVEQAPGVQAVRVVLRDHFADTEINGGVNGGRAFRAAFPGEALDDLDELRRKFLEKSFLARQEQLIRRLRQAGLGDEEIVGLRGADVEPQGEDIVVHQNQEPRTKNQEPDQTDCASGSRFSPALSAGEGVLGSPPVVVRLAAGDLEKYLRKRAGLGLPADGAARLFSELSGAPLRAEELAGYLRRSRTMRVSMAFNSAMCEGLLRARYHPDLNEDTTSVGDVLLTSH
ncbi:MAG TPA: iron-sulfur cluster assembly protein [Roseiflexaceae bacterium]|jgi:metal-sulfur cluster biosynthetic enzyme